MVTQTLYKAKYALEWSAALTVSSVCMSILSMLSSAKHKVFGLLYYMLTFY